MQASRFCLVHVVRLSPAAFAVLFGPNLGGKEHVNRRSENGKNATLVAPAIIFHSLAVLSVTYPRSTKPPTRHPVIPRQYHPCSAQQLSTLRTILPRDFIGSRRTRTLKEGARTKPVRRHSRNHGTHSAATKAQRRRTNTDSYQRRPERDM